MEAQVSLGGLASAIGLGLLIGVVRERAQASSPHSVAGIRTHLLAAIAGATSLALGTAVLVVVILLTGALALASYFRTRDSDPGLTGEMALPVTALLAALAQSQPALAAGVSVVVAGALFAKQPLHQLVRERVSEQELQDGLLLAGAALVVLPLLPDTAVDPWGVIVPQSLWRMVVLILAVGMTGHLLLRMVGARWGLPLAGFFAGFASSTAAVAGFGQRVRAEPAHVAAAAAAALFANIGSLVLLAGLVATGAPALFNVIVLPFAAAGLGMAAVASLILFRQASVQGLPAEERPRAFRLSHALLLSGLMGVLLLLSVALQRWLGSAGVLAAAAAVAMVEVHAAGASVAELAAVEKLTLEAASWGLVLLLLVSAVAKAILAFVSGGRGYGWRVLAGLLCMPALSAAGLAILNIYK